MFDLSGGFNGLRIGERLGLNGLKNVANHN